MKALLFCVFGICTLTLNAADLTLQQLAAADKVAHAYVDAWLAGEYEKAVVLSDAGYAIGTASRVARQASQYIVISGELEWGKPEVCENEFVAVKFTGLTTEYSVITGKKTVWWLGLVEIAGTWKVCYVNSRTAPHNLAEIVKRRAAVREDAQSELEQNMQSYKKEVDDFRVKQRAVKK